MAGHRGYLLVQGQGLHRKAPHRGTRRSKIHQGRRRRRGRPDGLRILDPVAESLGRRHPPAAGAAHRPEHDDEDDDRRQTARGAGPDRRRYSPGDERCAAGLNERRTKSGIEPEHRALFRKYDRSRPVISDRKAVRHTATGAMPPQTELRRAAGSGKFPPDTDGCRKTETIYGL